MSAPLFDFPIARDKFQSTVQHAVTASDVSLLETAFSDQFGSDVEKKAALDQAFRDVLTNLIKEESELDAYLLVISMAAEAVQHELCLPATLFLLLSDLFDCVTLEKCDSCFKFLEERVTMLKSDTFYNSGKNYLLRMCNDLLRRMSRSQNTVFCGRIQLFLARLFPLYEKSGLNLMSQFNLENVTLYNTKSEEYDKSRKLSFDDKDENMDYEEGETDDVTGSIPIDYNLYRKFWSLQDYFRKPVQCYDKIAWKTFTNYSDEVLGCFVSFKLDDTKSSRKKSEAHRKTHSHEYFAKFLTSEKLLDLQLSDSNFRRYVLVQFIITFQYLNARVKFKSATQVLTEEQSVWVKQTYDKVFGILRETPPDGEVFAAELEHLLSREENWNNWKNESCQSYVRADDDDERSPGKPHRAQKRSFGEDLKASGGKLIKMGNSELTRLWNLCPDNMEACRQEARNFLPKMDSFFEEAIEQADPKAMIEDQYRLVNNDSFAWKSLRLLARRSPHFFATMLGMPVVQMPKTIPRYLEVQLEKLAKEIKPSATPSNGEVKVEVEEASVEQEEPGGQDDQGDNELNDKNDEPHKDAPGEEEDEAARPLTKDQVNQVAIKLGNDWKKLATELNFPEDDIAYFETENETIEAQALKMITIWMENDPDSATVGALRTALNEVGQSVVADAVFGERDDAT